MALLVLDHKIALPDPVAKYLPEVSKYGDGLRIEHLVYKTSGLREYTDEPRSLAILCVILAPAPSSSKPIKKAKTGSTCTVLELRIC